MIPDGARFCPECGHDVRLRGDERRVVTVLFADLVGFTTMSETRDPEQVKNLVDACFQRMVIDIEAFGGRVDKIVGDAIVALFGAPIAHEDDGERAVRAGLRMQDSLQATASDLGVAVQMRVGVNTGEVLVGALRAGGDYTAMGDVVNIASRLQAAAEPGCVLVGPATYASTRRAVRYRPIGAVQTKGREEAVSAWVAEEAVLPPGYRPDRERAPLVGRESEMGLLRHSVDTAVRRRRAALVLLVGEAGVGKSRLAEELACAVEATHDALVLEGRCVPYGEANVWWPIADAVRHGLGVRSSDSEGVGRDLALMGVRTALGDGAGDTEIERVHAGLVHLMGYEGPLRAIDPARARDEATAALLTFTERYARQRPVLVVLSDLHWADDVVLEVLDALLERLTDQPFVVVATARRELDERWRAPAGRHNLVQLTVDPLDSDAARALLRSLTGPDLGDDLAAALLDRGGGNPFFLEELVALLSEAGMVGDGREGQPSADIDGAVRGRGELPDTLRGLVAARLDGLTPIERRVLDDMAVLGRRGPMVAIERLAGKHLGIEAVRPIVASLVGKELLTLSGEGPSEKWSFRSDLVREVAYGTLTKAERARIHAGIAEWMQAHEPVDQDVVVDRLAHHWVRAAELVRELGRVDDVPDDIQDRAVAWLGQAAERAMRAEALVVAAKLFGDGLHLMGDEPHPRRVSFLLGRARALGARREILQARADARRALEEAEACGDAPSAARAVLTLADLDQKEYRWAEADEHLQDASRRFAELGDGGGTAEALRLRGFGSMFQRDYDAARRLLGEARAAFLEVGDRAGAAWSLQNLAWCEFYTGQHEAAERRLRETIDEFTELGDRGGLAWATGLLAWTRLQQGYRAEAQEIGDAILADIREGGDRWATGVMLTLSALTRLWGGEPAAAVQRAAESLEIGEELADTFGRLQASGVLGRALVHSGRVQEGLAVLEKAVDLLGNDPSASDQVFFLMTMLGVAVRLGDVDLGEQIRSEVERAGITPDELYGEGDVSLALLSLQQGDPHRALRLLEAPAEGPVTAESAEMAAHHPPVEGYRGAITALCLAAAGRLDEALDLARAVEAAERSTYLDRLDARLAAGLVLARQGDLAAGTATIQTAADEVAATGDIVAGTIAKLARAALARAGDSDEAARLESEATAALDRLGIEASGWQATINTILAPVAR